MLKPSEPQRDRRRVDMTLITDEAMSVTMSRTDVETWLRSLWGVRPGSRSPRCQLTTEGLRPEIVNWMRHLWAVGSEVSADREGER